MEYCAYQLGLKLLRLHISFTLNLEHPSFWKKCGLYPRKYSSLVNVMLRRPQCHAFIHVHLFHQTLTMYSSKSKHKAIWRKWTKMRQISIPCSKMSKLNNQWYLPVLYHFEKNSSTCCADKRENTENHGKWTNSFIIIYIII